MVPLDPPHGTGRPGPHPEPPPDLHGRPIPFKRFDSAWHRVFDVEFDPIWFGATGTNRFDAPDREFGVLYVAGSPHGAFIETFGHATGEQFVTTSLLSNRGLARVLSTRPLRLVDLTGPGLARIGADQRLCTGDYAYAQPWSRALWAHPDKPDGIYYRSRHDPDEYCAALYDRVESHVEASTLGKFDAGHHRGLLADVLEHYEFGLIDDRR